MSPYFLVEWGHQTFAVQDQTALEALWATTVETAQACAVTGSTNKPQVILK